MLMLKIFQISEHSELHFRLYSNGGINKVLGEHRRENRLFGGGLRETTWVGKEQLQSDRNWQKQRGKVNFIFVVYLDLVYNLHRQVTAGKAKSINWGQTVMDPKTCSTFILRSLDFILKTMILNLLTLYVIFIC